ncbi:MAG: bifunctional phosphoribosylaminoimidazolecarboxamide formyltransferase/IMP cyclohydrolase [Planctomycetota bacterium]|nr:bifunctional phosphoribosylaminoimidazolecarboxamide formyltransferase/IMP cyclohydrolase [Planctomycetota bacterium]
MASDSSSLPAPVNLVVVRRALVSVSDKSGLAPLAALLKRWNIETISTGGTAKALELQGVRVVPIEQVTGWPEMLDGRVKTLHPKVHGGLLAVRGKPEHEAALRAHEISPIDLVCVNLYPFEQTLAAARGRTLPEGEAIEQIDIGGPSMIRSAAKNFAGVAVLTDWSQLEALDQELAKNDGATTLALRRRLAGDAFSRTARYDAAIGAWFASKLDASNDASGEQNQERLPVRLVLELDRLQPMRYGENPHQHAAAYRVRTIGGAPAAGATGEPEGVIGARHLHGKELSYNNVNDASAAMGLSRAIAQAMGEAQTSVGACVVKHANPCGASAAKSAERAVELALAGDPLAAYGGILACSAPLDAAAARHVARREVFLEAVLAPSFTPEALDLLTAKSGTMRLLEVGVDGSTSGVLEYRSVSGGMLVQGRDELLTPPANHTHRAGPRVNDEMLLAARFLEPVVRALTSNAVCIGGWTPQRDAMMLFGAGAGQMDRLTACRIACEKAGERARGGVAHSDAFFPFDDGPRILIDAGVTLIVHPGGSKRDGDTFNLCDERGVTCLTTQTRHFRH